MKTTNTSMHRMLLATLVMVLLGFSSYSTQRVDMRTANCQSTGNTISFDVYLRNTSTAGESVRITAFSIGLNLDTAVRNGGLITFQFVPNSWDNSLPNLANLYSGTNTATVQQNFAVTSSNSGKAQLKVSVANLGFSCASPSNIPVLTNVGDSVKIGRWIASTDAPTGWKHASDPHLSWNSNTTTSQGNANPGINTCNGATQVSINTSLNRTVEGGQLLASAANAPTSTNVATGCSFLLNGCSYAAGSPSSTPSLCGNTASGSVSASVTGSSGNITYTLNPGGMTSGPTPATSYTFNNVAPGSYTVTYVDGNGCGQTSPITVGAGPAAVDDGNPCTNDVCNPNGSTDHPFVANGTGVPSDGNACTNDFCQDGVAYTAVANGTTITDDGNPCTDDVCFNGNETHPNKADGTPIADDGNPCTNDVCIGGVASHPNKPDGSAIASDGNACTNDFCVGGVGYTAVADGTPITDDGNPCTNDVCFGGNETHPNRPDGSLIADDGNPCTDDVCIGGVPSHPNKADGSPLASDGNPCTNDFCQGGVAYTAVANGTPVADDGNPCTDDVCTAGNPSHPAKADGFPLPSDGNACTNDFCQGGVAYASVANGTPITDDGNPCTDDVCQGGMETHPNKANGSPLPSDGNACTNDFCQGGVAYTSVANGTPITDDGNPCTNDVCFNGNETHPNKADGTAIADDGNPCTDDVCIGGVASHPNKADGSPLASDGNPCTNDFCVGGVAYTTSADGTPIADDGNPCTDDVCFGGAPTHPAKADGTVLPSDGNACTNDFCQGGIAYTSVSDGTPIADDGNPCTNDVCQGGMETHPNKANGFPLPSDGNACTNDFCQGGVAYTAVANGTPITDDGNPCTNDVCQGGMETHPNKADGTPVADDGNPCTDDVCIAGVASHPNKANGSPLPSDGNACTNDFCQGGVAYTAVANGTPITDDGNPCTNDICFGGNETHPAKADGTPVADDGNPCTDDVCIGGAASHPNKADGSPLPSDGNPCTNDFCVGGVAYTASPDGTPIADDGNPCTNDICVGGVGSHQHVADGTPLPSDGNPCTNDFCVSGDPYTAVANGTPIADDGNPCTDDVCTAGNPTHPNKANGFPLPSDGNACTNDFCQGGVGYTAVANGTPITDDGNPCTNDVCQAGMETHPAKADGTPIADDGNPCTFDVCTAGNPSHPNKPDGSAAPSDGIPCTNDVCMGGVEQHNAYTMTATATPGTIACFGGSTCVTVSAMGGVGATTYSNGGPYGSSPVFCGYTAGGPYNFSAKDANGCTAASNPVVITQPDKLNVDSAQTTPSSCISNDGTATAFVSGGTGAYTYSWSPGGSTSNPATGLAGGSYTVTVHDANFCVASLSGIVVGSSGSSLPAPGPMSGPAGACKDQHGVVYSVPAQAGALSYNWTVPAQATIISGQGTNSITVNFGHTYAGGFVCVTSSNACGNSPSTCKNVPLLGSKPAKPVISGTSVTADHNHSIVCRPSTQTYCASSTNATSYTWVVDHGMSILAGQGTSCITVSIPANYDGGGHVKVTGVNCKGNGENKSIDVKLSTPTAPVITGPSVVCAPGTATYCASATSASGYNWTVDHGMSILSGQGTSCITVSVPATYDGAGHVKAKGTNCNGIGPETSYNVGKTSPIVGAPQFCIYDADDNFSSVCAPGTYEYELCQLTNSECFTWTAPAGAIINDDHGHTGNPLTVCPGITTGGDGQRQVHITFPAGFTSGDVTVSASNNCSTTATTSYHVTGHSCRLAGGEEAVATASLNAYPNPTSGKLNVIFAAVEKEKYTLKVVDLLGNVLVSQANTAHDGHNQIEVDLSNVAKGMYILSIERDGSKTETMRIVVE